MTQDLTTARRSLSSVSTDLKRGLYISAATAVRDGARLFGRVPMIKNEAEELTLLLQDACAHLSDDGELAGLLPFGLEYIPGQEGDLVREMNRLIETLQNASIEIALKKHAEHKSAALSKGKKLLAEGKLDEARLTFRKITEDYADDVDLATSVGDIFMQVGQFEEAYRFFAAAAKQAPPSPTMLNKLGMVLRRIKKYDQAESVYARAIDMAPDDPNLLFNMARVSLDRGDFPTAIKFSLKALELDPDFSEALKLISYARKKLG